VGVAILGTMIHMIIAMKGKTPCIKVRAKGYKFIIIYQGVKIGVKE
jgi:hypothetical protein